MRKLLPLTLLASLIATLAGVGASAVGTADPARLIPAPVPSAPRPTITLRPARGSAGQTIAVFGEGVASTPGVRVAWLASDATMTAAAVERQPSNAYAASIPVPTDIRPGAVQVCAAATGPALAAFACAPFTIDPPPPGRVAGKIDFTPNAAMAHHPQAINAHLKLYTRAGDLVASAPIQSDGSYSLENVPPGTYTGAVVGVVPVAVAVGGSVIVSAGSDTAVPIGPAYLERNYVDPVNGQKCKSSQAAAAVVTANPNGPPYNQNYHFGTYVSLGTGGSRVEVTFQAELQSEEGAAVERVEFHIQRPDKSLIALGADSSAPYQASYNVSELPPGLSRLIIAPVVNGQRQCPAGRFIEMIADPMQNELVRSGGSTTWDASAKRYTFSGVIPQLDRLPLTFPDPPPKLKLVGTIENTLDANLNVEGTLALNGDVRISLLRANALVRLLSRDLYSGGKNLPSSERAVIQSNDIQQSRVEFGPYTLASLGPKEISKEGVIATYFGLVTVKYRLALSIKGELTLEGYIKPLLPALKAKLTPSVSTRLSVSIWVDVLLGAASGGAEAAPEIALKLPLQLNTRASSPVSLGNPCVQIKVKLRVWAELLWKDFETTATPIDYSNPEGCGTTAQTFMATRELATPRRVMAAPSVASGPGGRMLAVYVQDTTPDAATPTRKVMARFWNAQKNGWGAAVPLTDGSHAVHDPVAAFGGPNGEALVVWTENTIALAEAAAYTDDLVGALRRQELFYATWDGASWSVPQRLTNNDVPDGRAAIAGSGAGATLAWVRDLDGDIRTRTDWRIAVQHWDAATKQWSSLTLLSAPDQKSASSNMQVSVAMGSSGPVLAWTTDADGDLTTNDDRRIAIAGYDAINAAWNIEIPSKLTGVDSPSIARVRLNRSSQETTLLAFIARGKDADSSGITLGNQGELWIVGPTSSGAWQAAQLRDGTAPIYAERPRVRAGTQGEALLLFRRFGAAGTNAELGQLALSRWIAGPLGPTGFSRPLYLTDEPQQHWQQDMAINEATGQAIVLDVTRKATGVGGIAATQHTLARASTAARPGLQFATLAAGDEPVGASVVEPAADPALDPALTMSQQHAVPGTVVTVNATVRNLGRADANGMAVAFYRGTPGSGTFLETVNLPGSLPFNEATTVAIQVTRANGEQPIYAELTAGSSNSNTANDRAIAALGALLPPTVVSANAGSRYSDALDLTWLPPDVPGVAGYRILRSTIPGGPYELVGEATATTYSDRLLNIGQTYHYIVQAYDADGVLSEYSAEAIGSLTPQETYLPLVQR